MKKSVRFSRLVMKKEEGEDRIYLDAVIIKVHTDSYDVKTSNGEVKKYVPNTTGGAFIDRESVVVLFDKDSDDYRIIGRGRKLSRISSIKMVEV